MRASVPILALVAATPLLILPGVLFYYDVTPKAALVLLGAALVVGFPLAAVLLRSLHLLSRRWGVLVPAGFVLADPMTLTDAVLFPREHIVGIGPADPKVRPPGGATDLRLGAAVGSLALLLDDDIDLYRRGRGVAQGERTHLLLFTPVAAAELLRLAASRSITVRS